MFVRHRESKRKVKRSRPDAPSVATKDAHFVHYLPQPLYAHQRCKSSQEAEREINCSYCSQHTDIHRCVCGSQQQQLPDVLLVDRLATVNKWKKIRRCLHHLDLFFFFLSPENHFWLRWTPRSSPINNNSVVFVLPSDGVRHTVRFSQKVANVESQKTSRFIDICAVCRFA